MAKYEVLFLLLLGIFSCESVSTNSEIKTDSNSVSTKKLQKASARISTVDGYETGASIPPLHFHSSPATSMNQIFTWFSDAAKPQIMGSGWYGFNHFPQRTARNMPVSRLRSTNLLGESTQLFPTINYYPNHHFHLDQSFGLRQPMSDLQSLGTVPHQDHFMHSRFLRLEQPIFPNRRFLVPVIRPRPQRPVFERHHQPFNYRQASDNIQRSAASPTPVTIKIVPLKLSSVDLANALKSMSWIPIPLDMLKLNANQNSNGNEEDNKQTYSDKRQSMFDDDDDDESDLPPPSSHVATPPLGITYAEGQRSERFVNPRFQPRK